MNIETRAEHSIGNPVRSEFLLRVLRSPAGAITLAIWTILMASLGAVVLVSEGVDDPFTRGPGISDLMGTALAQWWIVGLTGGVALLGAIHSAVSCAGSGQARRLRAWSPTLVKPSQVVLGMWLAQVSFVVLAIIVAMPVAGIALGAGGTSIAQLSAGALGALVVGASISALGIAISCRARRPLAPAIVLVVLVTTFMLGPLFVHRMGSLSPELDARVLTVSPLVGVADATDPIAHPPVRFDHVVCVAGSSCVRHAPWTQWENRTNAAAEPLTNLHSAVRYHNDAIPTWGWTAMGAVVVMALSLVVATLRVGRS